MVVSAWLIFEPPSEYCIVWCTVVPLPLLSLLASMVTPLVARFCAIMSQNTRWGLVRILAHHKLLPSTSNITPPIYSHSSGLRFHTLNVMQLLYRLKKGNPSR